LAIALILGLAWVNYFGVKLGGQVQTAVTVVKVGMILAIVLLAALLGGGESGNLVSTVSHRGGLQGFFAALVAALWAYDGWNNLNMVSSEIKNPQRNIPRALILGCCWWAPLTYAPTSPIFTCSRRRKSPPPIAWPAKRRASFWAMQEATLWLWRR
jgi:amino acid transporter